ncbi:MULTISPECIES: mycofactocin oligosaccharide methyltransferase MftM [Janibacter]|uniref:Class I SAM-dependent methyltransferase n=1 Tax=Janibacter terrae TaxID=103817 RepID=A0ABZ2F971_9MICO|nr:MULTISPECIES: mycofactocin oligosaccharide methyltransferase MftM [Janibacter]MBA4086053.1 class I SAM-dependent methyltransferase [Kytococcus sp.]
MIPVVASAEPRPIDPLAPGRPAYVDDLVRVVRTDGELPRRTLRTVRTEHFDISHEGGRVAIAHRVPLEEVHAGLAELLSREIFGPGWLRGADVFERIMTGIVLTSADDPLSAWEHFYRTSLRTIEAATDLADSPSAGMHGAVAGYAPVYARAEEVLVGDSVVELGSCFGFFSLRQAGTREVTAIDVSAGSIRLLEQVSAQLGTPVEALTADAAHVPLPDGCADTVVALHLLEHLEPQHGWRVVTEAVRLARRRVVIAVPYEDEPEELWGHVRTLTREDLAAYGLRTGLPFAVEEHHGGWLVLDLA